MPTEGHDEPATRQPDRLPVQSTLPLMEAASADTANEPAPAAPGHTNATPKTFDTNDYRHGHRQRLRARFDASETLADYELLELLLFRSIPRRDTKPIAHALMKRFGSFTAVVSAPASELKSVKGIGNSVTADFKLIRAAAERFAFASLAQKDLVKSTDDVITYYRVQLRDAVREEFHTLFLDRRNHVIASERLASGTVDHTPVYPREVLQAALRHGATAIVLVHNHPSGDPTPSREDVSMTHKLIAALEPVSISVHDHLIIGRHKAVSLRAEGLI
ncbi:MAG: DNA repair protein RadC [Pseudomonadota bacterium]